MAFKFPSVSSVRLPTGAIQRNLPLMVGVPLCVVLTLAIMFTGEDPAGEQAPNPLTSSRPEATIPDSLGNPVAVDSVGRQIENAVRDLTADRDAQLLARQQAALQARMNAVGMNSACAMTLLALAALSRITVAHLRSCRPCSPSRRRFSPRMRLPCGRSRGA